MRPLISALFIALAGALLSPALPALAQADGVPIGGNVTFEPKPGTILRLEGKGPYRGSLEVRPTGAAVVVVNELDLESYVMGIREVPGSWPMEALKAQAVAARTYALWEKENGAWARHGYDLCATVDCQVYGGALAERGEQGRRWVRAVRETAGEVLLSGGEPILARYHASSGGRTLANETVYPSSGARSYLVSVADEADEVSPLHRWTVDFTREGMQEILRSGIGLVGNLVEIEADQDARRVRVRTEGGELEMNAVRLRRVVSEHAPRLYPDEYPSPRNDGLLMPLTLPSSRFDVERTDTGFRFHGRGYGHGVGMGQWGAKGRAERGDTYDEILAAYYGGLNPQAWTGETQVRVAIVRGGPDARVFGDGAFSVRAGSDVLAASTLGSWGAAPAGPGTLHLQAPEGADLPLVLSGLTVPAEHVLAPDRPWLDVDFVVPKAAQVEAVLSREGGEVATAREVYEAGPGRLRLDLAEARLPRRGDFTLTVRAFDGEETVERVLPVSISQPGRGPLTWAFLALFVLLAAGTLVGRTNRRPIPPPPSESRPPAESVRPGV